MAEKAKFTTRASLAASIAALVGPSWRGDEIPIPGSRRRWDMAYLDRDTVVAVEYDGDEHYRHSLKIKADREKDAAAQGLGYKVVRFPYWIQLDTMTLQHFFGLQSEIQTDFPHGFITTKHFPASFCELGISRFAHELATLPAEVSVAVVSSLRDRAAEHGIEYVVPSSLVNLIAP